MKKAKTQAEKDEIKERQDELKRQDAVEKRSRSYTCAGLVPALPENEYLGNNILFQLLQQAKTAFSSHS